MPSDLAKEINQILSGYTKEIDESMRKVIKETAQEAASKVKKNASEAFGNGPYAQSWGVQMRDPLHAVVRAKSPGYQLAHLLEHGHDIVMNGVKVGEAKAHPHIKEVEEWAQKETVKRMEDLL